VPGYDTSNRGGGKRKGKGREKKRKKKRMCLLVFFSRLTGRPHQPEPRGGRREERERGGGCASPISLCLCSCEISGRKREEEGKEGKAASCMVGVGLFDPARHPRDAGIRASERGGKKRRRGEKKLYVINRHPITIIRLTRAAGGEGGRGGERGKGKKGKEISFSSLTASLSLW